MCISAKDLTLYTLSNQHTLHNCDTLCETDFCPGRLHVCLMQKLEQAAESGTLECPHCTAQSSVKWHTRLLWLAPSLYPMHAESVISIKYIYLKSYYFYLIYRN